MIRIGDGDDDDRNIGSAARAKRLIHGSEGPQYALDLSLDNKKLLNEKANYDFIKNCSFSQPMHNCIVLLVRLYGLHQFS
jgi:hypothetical protein